MTLQSINPSTGKAICERDEMERDEIAWTIDDVHRAFLEWRHTRFSERSALMQAAGHLLREQANDLARLMAEEMGKPITEGIAEAQKCALACDYFAENAEKFLAREVVGDDGVRSFVAFQPLGVSRALLASLLPTAGGSLSGTWTGSFSMRQADGSVAERGSAYLQLQQQ